MKWYIARIVFQVISGDGCHKGQFDEQWRLIKAAGEQDAYTKAVAIGRQEEDEFINSARETVQWKYTGIAELRETAEPHDGMEIVSRLDETDDAARYIHAIKQKTAEIEAGLIPLMLN